MSTGDVAYIEDDSQYCCVLLSRITRVTTNLYENIPRNVNTIGLLAKFEEFIGKLLQFKYLLELANDDFGNLK